MTRLRLIVAFSVVLLPETAATAQAQNPTPCHLEDDGTVEPHLVPDYWYYSGGGLPQRVLSLTYDDGPSRPSPATSLAIAAYLHDQGVRATFFVETGPHLGAANPNCGSPGGPSWPLASELPDLSVLSAIAGLGHRVANHTENHFRLDTLQPADVKSQVCVAQTKVDPNITDGIFLFRPPYGVWDNFPDGAGQTTHLSDLLRADSQFNRIVGPVLWTFSIHNESPGDTYSSDWDCARFGHTPQQCGDRLLMDLDANPTKGGTILFHDWIWNNAPSCPPVMDGTWALDLAKYIVPRLKERGYLILPLDADRTLPGGNLLGTLGTWTSSFGDADGWGTNVGYYGTFRLGDVNGDHRMDLCARGAAGVFCSLSQGSSFSSGYALWQPDLSNANGWLPSYHSTTLQLGDVNGDGKDDACALGAAGILCATSNGSSLGPLTVWLDKAFLPPGIYSNVGYYGTLRLAKVSAGTSTRRDLCFRAPSGVMCALSTGTSFQAPTLWSSFFSDAQGWLPAFYSTTLQLADVDGDGAADVCARGAAGIYCGLSTGTSFSQATHFSAGFNFGNADGFHTSSNYYATLRFADVDGDGRADACIRSSAGILCAKSLGTRFDSYRVWQKADFRDDGGWLSESYSATVSLGDLTGDGVADVCARVAGGVACALAPAAQ